MWKRYRGRSRAAGARPSRTWASVAGSFGLNAVTTTTSATLIQMQAPTDLSNLTSDPPEDITLLRIRGSFTCLLSSITVSSWWTLALLVQDTTWTPASTFATDADKRILWSRDFYAGTAVSHLWGPPGQLLYDLAGTVSTAGMPGCTDVDVAPKAKVEPGKALFLVGYENSGTGTLNVASVNMRVLFQRTQRRR